MICQFFLQASARLRLVFRPEVCSPGAQTLLRLVFRHRILPPGGNILLQSISWSSALGFVHLVDKPYFNCGLTAWRSNPTSIIFFNALAVSSNKPKIARLGSKTHKMANQTKGKGIYRSLTESDDVRRASFVVQCSSSSRISEFVVQRSPSSGSCELVVHLQARR